MVLPALTPEQQEMMLKMSTNTTVKAKFSMEEEGMMVLTANKSHIMVHWFEYLLLQISENICPKALTHKEFATNILNCAFSSEIHPVEYVHKIYIKEKYNG